MISHGTAGCCSVPYITTLGKIFAVAATRRDSRKPGAARSGTITRITIPNTVWILVVLSQGAST